MTNLKDKWEAAFGQFPHKDDILKDIRQEALRFFVSNGFPHKRYGSILPLREYKPQTTRCGNLPMLKRH